MNEIVYLDREGESRDAPMPFGHWCQGLQGYYEQSAFLVPYFDENGIVQGESGESTVPISFCPFCGTHIKP